MFPSGGTSLQGSSSATSGINKNVTLGGLGTTQILLIGIIAVVLIFLWKRK